VSTQIRDAVAGDLDALRALFRRSALSNEGDRQVLLANPDALEFPRLAVDEGRTRAAVDDGGYIVGFATPLFLGRLVEVEDLFVEPAEMRRGIGRKLIDDLIATARAKGAERLEVTANPHALGFYEKLGFVDAGLDETRFGPAPRLRLELS